MASVNIAGDTSGVVTLQAPSVAGTTTLNLPAQSGTVMVNGPAFSAYPSSNQTLSSGVNTKILFQTKEWDTANCYDTSTSRFTPTVAGYYQVNATVVANSSTTTISLFIFKNGVVDKALTVTNTATLSYLNGSALVYLNGTTDYIEIYATFGTGQALFGTKGYTYFQASMVRSA